jgi:hypothetical protein
LVKKKTHTHTTCQGVFFGNISGEMKNGDGEGEKGFDLKMQQQET